MLLFRCLFRTLGAILGPVAPGLKSLAALGAFFGILPELIGHGLVQGPNYITEIIAAGVQACFQDAAVAEMCIRDSGRAGELHRKGKSGCGEYTTARFSFATPYPKSRRTAIL